MKIKIKRPLSAVKTTMRAKKLVKSFAQPTCPCSNHHHDNIDYESRNSHYHHNDNSHLRTMNEDLDDSPSRINKSVSFNH
jgi:hypothetical protein